MGMRSSGLGLRSSPTLPWMMFVLSDARSIGCIQLRIDTRICLVCFSQGVTCVDIEVYLGSYTLLSMRPSPPVCRFQLIFKIPVAHVYILHSGKVGIGPLQQRACGCGSGK